VDGQLTLGENIADNSGIKKSYESWMALYRSDPQGKKYNNQRLPGLEHFTPEQMFFIQFGRLWCNKARPESAKQQLQNEHSPPQWRVKGVVQNSEYFAKAFKCKAGQPMNPVKKCNVW
jgi:endothelin-converting enzyme